MAESVWLGTGGVWRIRTDIGLPRGADTNSYASSDIGAKQRPDVAANGFTNSPAESGADTSPVGYSYLSANPSAQSTSNTTSVFAALGSTDKPAFKPAYSTSVASTHTLAVSTT